MVPSFYPFVALMLADGTSPGDCFRLPRDSARALDLLRTPAGRMTISRFLRKPVGDIDWTRFDEQLRAVERLGAGVVTFVDDGYPPCFEDIAQAPPLLFYRGDLNTIRERGAAVVGSRRASARGAAFTRSLAGDLAGLGILVASGAAQGIDTAAHRGALSRGGSTVAVLGTGLDVPFPAGNATLIDEIARKGCVISEQLMGTPPLKYVFPRRNRLISALSHAVVVVEAGERSGALITARWALEQGRDVGAVPGFPGDPRSRGSNALIKAGAFPVESVQDILDAIPTLAAIAAARAKGRVGAVGGENRGHGAPAASQSVGVGRAGSAPPGLSSAVSDVLSAVGSSPIDADAVARHLGLPVSVVQRCFLDLELEGLIERDRSGLYYRS